MKKDLAKTICICKGCKELIRNKIMLTAKDIHIGDLFKMTSKYPDDRFNNRYILVKSITKDIMILFGLKHS